MSSDIGLNEQGALVRVNAASEEGRRCLQGELLRQVLFSERRRRECDLVLRIILSFIHFLADELLSDRMVVNDAVISLQIVSVTRMILKMNPVLHSAQIVSKMDKARGLDAGEHDLLYELLLCHSKFIIIKISVAQN